MLIRTCLVMCAVAQLLLTSTLHAQMNACGPGHLVTIEADGTASSGSKDRLRRAAEAGTPIRVGWTIDANHDGVPDLTHWADAGFISEFAGEVFAQLADIQRQTPVASEKRIRMPAGQQRWTGLIGTTGTLESHFDDGTEPPPTRVRSTWCIDARATSCAPQWRLVYRHDPDGRPLTGSKSALLDAIRRGASLRLAWGFAGSASAPEVMVEHTADPVFVTIMKGEHVFAQLPEHIGQASYSNPDEARFDQSSVMWRGLMGSDGTFDAVLVDRATGKEVRRLPQRAGIAWFAELPAPECPGQEPLTLAVPGGTRRK